MAENTPERASESTPEPTTDFAKIQATFKKLNPYVLLMWRLHLGWCMSVIPPLTGKTMVVTHTGRKSGRTLRTPCNYAVIDGDVWATTMSQANWLRNIQANPAVQVWLPLRRPRHGVAEQVPVDAEHLNQFRAVHMAGGRIAAHFDSFNARKVTDAELLEHGHGFHLLRIRLGDRVSRGAANGVPRP